jgi:hypothetical protein
VEDKKEKSAEDIQLVVQLNHNVPNPREKRKVPNV